jgi:hypothetical protein
VTVSAGARVPVGVTFTVGAGLTGTLQTTVTVFNQGAGSGEQQHVGFHDADRVSAQ